MAETNIPILAVGKYEYIQPLIDLKRITYPAYIACTDEDSPKFVFVDKDLNIIDLTGSGNSSFNGSYNALSDTPVINKTGTITAIVTLEDLDNGIYAVDGNYKIVDNGTTNITPNKVLCVVDSDDDNKYITLYNGSNITLYTIVSETGELITDNYITESWLASHDYITIKDLQEAIAELSKEIEESRVTKVSQLENDEGYLKDDDVKAIIEEEIAGLFQ